jgi:mono/diheme cytochrome c family protein
VKRRLGLAALIAFVVLVVALAIVVALNLRGEDRIAADEMAFSPSLDQIRRGEYLARAGNCMACHTVRGGTPYAGGRPIATPFGTLFSTNLTPDAKTGLGSWTPGHFWRALHNGRSKDGRLLYPAFPYTEYTTVNREDADAIFAYLTSLPPAEQPARPHELRFPYNSQIALAVWRALFFEPRTFRDDASKTAEWNRGAYLVTGLGHCIACHGSRNVLGASTDLELSGGLIPSIGWYAPSLLSKDEAGVAHWRKEEIISLLKKGVSRQASTMGPMAEVVFTSTQFLSPADLSAMAAYLMDLPKSTHNRDAQSIASALAENVRVRGGKIYETHCANCHGVSGEGVSGAYPALAGNRAVQLAVPANVIRVLLSGGYLPATQGNPRPFGMPPFAHVLSDNEIALISTYIRGAWGNNGKAVSAQQVTQFRARTVGSR